MKKLILISLITFLISSNCFAEVITGKVTDTKSNNPVISASVRLLGTSKGTYANKDGVFKLPGVKIGDKIKFSSIGFKSETIQIKNFDYLDIKLDEAKVEMSEATVTADIDVKEIIKRAIKNKDANQNKIKTVEQTLFSKIKVELGGELYKFSNPLPGTENTELERDLWKNIIAENYSKSYIDYEKNIFKDVILKRRNTSNMKSEYNLYSLSQFVNFYANIIGINNTRFTSPLSNDALDEYEYKLVSKELSDGKYIYVIDFKSISNVYPGFIGKMNILEDTYELTYIKAKPISDDLIQYISNIEFEEKFEKIDSNYWYPTLLNTTGKLDIEIIPGLSVLTADASAMSVVENIKINQPLPDSIYSSESENRFEAAKDADSSVAEFWANNSLINTTDEERQIYKNTDSLAKKVAKKDSVEEGSLHLSYLPYLRLNRVDGFTLGLSPSLEVSRYFNPKFFGAYAFSSYNWYYGINAESELFDNFKAKLEFEKNTFPLSINNNTDILLSSLTSLFVRDYYDWYMADRVEGNLTYHYYNLQLSGYYRNELISNIDNHNPKLDKQYTWRENRVINEGRFQQIGLSTRFVNNGNVNRNSWEYSIAASLILGKDENNSGFNMLFGELNSAIPIFNTGFEPASLTLDFKTGISHNAPPHLLYKMNTQIVIFKINNRFLSADYTKFGGSEFLEIHAGVDFTDFLWRAAGLPKYKWRGLGLELNYSAGYFKQDDYLLYMGTNERFYNEVGFNITKIPSFITSLVQLEAGFRWGVGSLGKGNFGFGINLSSPLFK